MLVPADMTDQVCKGKNAVNFARGNDLGGWGFSLGRYETAELANMALRGRLLGAREMVEGGASGVIRLPGANGYAAMVWDIDQNSSQVLGLPRTKIYCDVMSPPALPWSGADRQPPQTANGDASVQPRRNPRRSASGSHRSDRKDRASIACALAAAAFMG
jgi:hypothetical protein